MTPSRRSRIAWSVCAISVLATSAAVVLEGVNRGLIAVTENTGINYVAVVMGIAFSWVGALITSRFYRHTVGLILSIVGFTSAVNVFAIAYSTYVLVARPGALPGGVFMAWLSAWSWAPGVELLPLLLLFFPNGRLLSPRWRVAAWSVWVITPIVIVILAITPFSETVPELGVANPSPVIISVGTSLAFAISLNIAFFFLLIASVVSMVLRFRRSRGEERAQLKWVAFTSALMLTALLLNLALIAASIGIPGAILPTLGIGALIVSIGVAILKYRLYEIDRVINRTLVYGLLTALLGLSYAGIVVLLQEILAPVTDDQSYAVVGSTLAVAALFRPARARTQGFIDRRFYRRKYDAARTLEAFTAQVRDEIDLESLTGHLLSTVQETVQPARLSLWLRSSEAEPYAERDGNNGNLVGNAIRNDPGTMVL